MRRATGKWLSPIPRRSNIRRRVESSEAYSAGCFRHRSIPTPQNKHGKASNTNLAARYQRGLGDSRANIPWVIGSAGNTYKPKANSAREITRDTPWLKRV